MTDLLHLTDKRFNQVIGYVLNSEGGYVNNPKDPGGATQRGIAYNYNVVILRDLFKINSPGEIKTLTSNQAKEIYFRKYWQSVGLQSIQDTAYAYVAFDACVNHGPGVLAGWVNKQARVFAGDGKNVNFYRNLRRDFLRKRNQAYFSYRNFDTFGLGWTNRLIDVSTYAERIKPAGVLTLLAGGYKMAFPPENIPEFAQEVWLMQAEKAA